MGVCTQSLSCVQLSATPWTVPPGSSVNETCQARRLEWAAISSSRDLPDRDGACVPYTGRKIPTTEPGGRHCGAYQWNVKQPLYSWKTTCAPKMLASLLLQTVLSKTWRLLVFQIISRGHRTGKGQFSFQSLRKAIPKNIQTTTQLHSSHTLAK